MEAPVEDSSCDAEAGSSEARWPLYSSLPDGFAAKRIYEVFETGEIARGVALLENKVEDSATLFERGEVAFRTADVPGQDHVRPAARCDTRHRG